jgi:hypothetical protein
LKFEPQSQHILFRKRKNGNPKQKIQRFQRIFLPLFPGVSKQPNRNPYGTKRKEAWNPKEKKKKKVPSELVEKAGARERRKVKRTEKRGREAISDHGALCVWGYACEETTKICWVFVFVLCMWSERKIVERGRQGEWVKSNAYDVSISKLYCFRPVQLCRPMGRGRGKVTRRSWVSATLAALLAWAPTWGKLAWLFWEPVDWKLETFCFWMSAFYQPQWFSTPHRFRQKIIIIKKKTKYRARL